MGYDLFDRKTRKIDFHCNLVHYRGIVEAIRRLDILSEEKVDELYSCYEDLGLTADESRLVATAFRNRLLPSLGDDEWLLPDGRTMGDHEVKTDFEKLCKEHNNCLTNRKALEKFAQFCETCNGFYVC